MSDCPNARALSSRGSLDLRRVSAMCTILAFHSLDVAITDTFVVYKAGGVHFCDDINKAIGSEHLGVRAKMSRMKHWTLRRHQIFGKCAPSTSRCGVESAG